jgi:hypothetical protein
MKLSYWSEGGNKICDHFYLENSSTGNILNHIITTYKQRNKLSQSYKQKDRN